MIVRLLGAAPMAKIAMATTRNRVRAVAYHDVPRPDAFAAQLDWIGDRFTTVTGRQMADALNGGAALPNRAIWLTFDDGDVSVIRAALPLLPARDMVVTAFDRLLHTITAMRAVEEVRAAKLEEFRSAVERPEMWARDGSSMETVGLGMLSDLCFIDERDGEYKRAREALFSYGKLGIAGAFEAVFGEDCRYTAEVASVVARMAFELGYLDPVRRLSELEWQSLTAGVRESFDGADVRMSQIAEAFGPASLTVGRRVMCYVGPSVDDWIAFDCWEAPTTRYVVGKGGGFRAEFANDPLVRDVRVPASSFSDGLIMTIYGSVLRWGPGWWLRAEPHSEDTAAERIAEQLRSIDERDPSQSLRPRRP